MRFRMGASEEEQRAYCSAAAAGIASSLCALQAEGGGEDAVCTLAGRCGAVSRVALVCSAALMASGNANTALVPYLYIRGRASRCDHAFSFGFASDGRV